MRTSKPVIRFNKFQIIKKFAWLPYQYVDTKDIQHTIWLETIYVVRRKDEMYNISYLTSKATYYCWAMDTPIGSILGMRENCEFICNKSVSTKEDVINYNKILIGGNHEDLRLVFDIILDKM